MAWTKATSTESGILRPARFATACELERLACAPEVSPWVENHWVLRWDLPEGATFTGSVAAHPSCNVTVERGHPRPGVGDERVLLTGVATKRFDAPLAGIGWVFGVKFRPGGQAAYTGIPASAVTDRVVPASELLAPAVVEGLRALEPSTPDPAAVADEALARHRPSPDPGHGRLLAIVTDLLEDRSLVRVAQVEERHAIGRRTLQRLFRHYVGVGPKWVLARYRMHDVLDELDRGHDGSLAELAARYGWYDQAHFARDFRALTGVSPSEYRTPDAASPQRRAPRR